MQGPRSMVIWGMTPEYMDWRRKYQSIPAVATSSYPRRPPEESSRLTMGMPHWAAISRGRANLTRCWAPMDPPNTVKSLAWIIIRRPFTRAVPTTAPSHGASGMRPSMRLPVVPTNEPSSLKLPASIRISILSRAVNLPRPCCLSICLRPPPRRFFSWISSYRLMASSIRLPMIGSFI